MKKNYYVVLGVQSDDTPEAIRAAYHQLARQLHPDIAGRSGTAAFQELSEAYEVLSDPVRRRSYDESIGQPGAGVQIPVRRAAMPEPISLHPFSLYSEVESIRPSFDAFRDRYSRNFSGIGIPKSEHPESLTVDVVLSPVEAWNGCSVPVGIPSLERCRNCGGSGHVWPFSCLACGGSGSVERSRTLWVVVPPRVRPGAVIEVSLNGLGITNLYLHVHVSISAET